jgi:hypothetical protein
LHSNIHSGIREAYVPFDSQAKVSARGRAMLPLLERVAGRHCRCPVGAGGITGVYLAHGTRSVPNTGLCAVAVSLMVAGFVSMDYFSEVLEVPYTFTYEVFGSDGDCAAMFNPLTDAAYWYCRGLSSP